MVLLNLLLNGLFSLNPRELGALGGRQLLLIASDSSGTRATVGLVTRRL